jgi:hypothetical protein
VFQPFDNGAPDYMSAYNGGHPNVWVLFPGDLPARTRDIDQFVRDRDIHYFITQSNLKPVEIERIGATQFAMANAVVAREMPHARALLSDGMGMTLYQIEPQAGR